ncbi:hypothetical protein [Chishuiella changwenlii]|uniref:hypothetical protein n=1 Tax=Chishuiella changwenlii TaxID=1434701 RepID=UPI002FD9B15D
MKNVFYCLTLLFFNSVYSKGTTTFPKIALNAISQSQIQSHIEEINTTPTLVNNLSSPIIFTSLVNMNTIIRLIDKLETFPINTTG